MKKNKIKTITIIYFLLAATIEFIATIITKNITYLNFSLLWVLLLVVKISDYKIIEEKEKELHIQKLLNEKYKESILNAERMVDFEIIKLQDISIPKYFRKVRTEKLTERRKYFEDYNNFETSIILNEKNVLIDGYTTYLIAKENGLSHIYIKRKF